MFRVNLENKESDFKTVRDGLPQGSMPTPLLLNIYITDLLYTQSRKFIYAYDFALTTQGLDIVITENTLTVDLLTLKDYF